MDPIRSEHASTPVGQATINSAPTLITLMVAL